MTSFVVNVISFLTHLDHLIKFTFVVWFHLPFLLGNIISILMLNHLHPINEQITNMDEYSYSYIKPRDISLYSCRLSYLYTCMLRSYCTDSYLLF